MTSFYVELKADILYCGRHRDFYIAKTDNEFQPSDEKQKWELRDLICSMWMKTHGGKQNILWTSV